MMEKRPTGTHIVDGEFQSDKYPTCPRGLVPLKLTDPDAQDLLWEYAQRHVARDPEFSEDIVTCLKAKRFVPTVSLKRQLVVAEALLMGAHPNTVDAILLHADELWNTQRQECRGWMLGERRRHPEYFA